MTIYNAPTRDMRFVIEELAGLGQINTLPQYEEATEDLVEAVLEEAARLAGEVLAPLNMSGDKEGARIVDGEVKAATGFGDAYQQFVEGGWNGLAFSPEHDGQGLPALVGTAVQEMWQSANMAFALCPMLTQGAVEAVEAHGSDAIKHTYLSKMVTGEWTGTMNLTEPQAGSDLSAVRSIAVPEGDHHLITGQKIFITWGDHDVAENIVHLVLARLPDAPEGTRGISLFIVPKYMPGDDGSLGVLNDVRPVSLEHKLGIHASPTCIMSFGDKGGAVGYLLGEANKGLACMFTMMNHARLTVGLQGLAIAERSYQQASDFARGRVQGGAPGQTGRVTIIRHPDVRRMLMQMRAYIEAMRAVAYVTAAHMDLAHASSDAADREKHQTRVDLLTPVVKGWCTEIAQELTSLGMQVHGGMGYVEETGAAQHFRDARITTIYEGTTGIQAMDLAGRKILRDKGAAAYDLIGDMRQTLETFKEQQCDLPIALAPALEAAADNLTSAIDWLVQQGPQDPDAAGAVAVNLMLLMGTALGTWQMARGALVARQKLAASEGDPDFLQAKLITARFYAEQIAPRCEAHLLAVLSGSEATMALSDEQF